MVFCEASGGPFRMGGKWLELLDVAGMGGARVSGCGNRLRTKLPAVGHLLLWGGQYWPQPPFEATRAE